MARMNGILPSQEIQGPIGQQQASQEDFAPDARQVRYAEEGSKESAGSATQAAIASAKAAGALGDGVTSVGDAVQARQELLEGSDAIAQMATVSKNLTVELARRRHQADQDGEGIHTFASDFLSYANDQLSPYANRYKTDKAKLMVQDQVAKIQANLAPVAYDDQSQLIGAKVGKDYQTVVNDGGSGIAVDPNNFGAASYMLKSATQHYQDTSQVDKQDLQRLQTDGLHSLAMAAMKSNLDQRPEYAKQIADGKIKLTGDQDFMQYLTPEDKVDMASRALGKIKERDLFKQHLEDEAIKTAERQHAGKAAQNAIDLNNPDTATKTYENMKKDVYDAKNNPSGNKQEDFDRAMQIMHRDDDRGREAATRGGDEARETNMGDLVRVITNDASSNEEKQDALEKFMTDRYSSKNPTGNKFGQMMAANELFSKAPSANWGRITHLMKNLTGENAYDPDVLKQNQKELTQMIADNAFGGTSGHLAIAQALLNDSNLQKNDQWKFTVKSARQALDRAGASLPMDSSGQRYSDRAFSLWMQAALPIAQKGLKAGDSDVFDPKDGPLSKLLTQFNPADLAAIDAKSRRSDATATSNSAPGIWSNIFTPLTAKEAAAQEEFKGKARAFMNSLPSLSSIPEKVTALTKWLHDNAPVTSKGISPAALSSIRSAFKNSQPIGGYSNMDFGEGEVSPPKPESKLTKAEQDRFNKNFPGGSTEK